MYFDDILIPDDIFENVISQEDVYNFFIRHQKRIGKSVLDGQDQWFYKSNRCEIGAVPGCKGNLVKKACLGCTLACRLTQDCVFPKFFEKESKTVYEIGRSILRVYEKGRNEKEKFAKKFANDSILTYLLDEYNSGGGILFVYECCGKIIVIMEASSPIGFGFDGIISRKGKNIMCQEKLDGLIDKIKNIDRVLRQNNFVFQALSDKTKNFAIVYTPNGELSIKFYSSEEDKVDSTGEYKSILSVAERIM